MEKTGAEWSQHLVFTKQKEDFVERFVLAAMLLFGVLAGTQTRAAETEAITDSVDSQAVVADDMGSWDRFRPQPPRPGNCSGNYNISINGFYGQLSIYDDGRGNISGSVFGDTIQGYCDRGQISFTRYIRDGRKYLTQYYQGYRQGRGYSGTMTSQNAGPGGAWTAY